MLRISAGSVLAVSIRASLVRIGSLRQGAKKFAIAPSVLRNEKTGNSKLPLKYLPRVLVSGVIGAVLFMSIMPDSIKGIPEWAFYSLFATSLLAGWLAATALFKIVRWFLERSSG
jgi:hypothetical protein